MEKRTRHMTMRVSEAEGAEIKAFLKDAGLSLPDFVLTAIRSGNFKRCPHCGGVMGQWGCPNNSAPYPQVKYRAKRFEEYQKDGEYFLVADGKIYHWNEDDL